MITLLFQSSITAQNIFTIFAWIFEIRRFCLYKRTIQTHSHFSVYCIGYVTVLELYPCLEYIHDFYAIYLNLEILSIKGELNSSFLTFHFEVCNNICALQFLRFCVIILSFQKSAYKRSNSVNIVISQSLTLLSLVF